MTVTIDNKDLDNLRKGIMDVGVEAIIAEAKRSGLKVESKSGEIKVSGENAQVNKFVENLSK